MALVAVAPVGEHGRPSALPSGHLHSEHAHASAVSWSAILAGAAAAAALSLILLMLGIGFGLSAVSPWKLDGVSAATFGISTIAWITLTQLIASGMGGYLAGRLRTKWIETHTDEVYFRDTAHGFLAWAVASLATAALLTTVIGSIIGSGVQAGASVVGSAAMVASAGGTPSAGSAMEKFDSDSGSTLYFVDSLFRRDMNAATVPSANGTNGVISGSLSQPAYTAEFTRIFMNTARTGALPTDDVRYLGQVVAQRTGLTQQDAEKKVTDTYARLQAKLRDAESAAKEAADKGRKASAYAALWLFVSLLIGAFVASLAATYGGRRRDA